MNENIILSQLEEVAQKLGINIRYETFRKSDFLHIGGLCRVEGQYIFIISSKATMGEKIQTLARALKRFDLTHIYIRPALREFLDKISD